MDPGETATKDYTVMDPADLGFTDLSPETLEMYAVPMFALEQRGGYTASFLDGPDQEIRDHVYLQHIFVPDDLRSKGVGRAMLKAILGKMDEAVQRNGATRHQHEATE